MGLFGFLKRRSAIETRLIEEHANLYAQILGDEQQSRKFAENMVTKVRAEAEAENTLNLPPDTGDRLLAKAATDEKLALQLRQKREDGATDNDIRWWWSLNDLERRVMLADDEFHRFCMFRSNLADGLCPDDAIVRVRKYLPLYDVYEEGSMKNAPTGEDRPLPVELKRRVNDWRMRFIRKGESGAEKMKQKVEASSSFNAIIRHEIRERSL